MQSFVCNILSEDIAHNACFTNFISDSHELTIHWLMGGLSFHVMFLKFKCCVILLLSSSSNALTSDSPPIKLLPLSDAIILTYPLVINQVRANKNYVAVRLSTTSRCNALIVNQRKIIPYRLYKDGFFSSIFCCFNFYWTKIINPW